MPEEEGRVAYALCLLDEALRGAEVLAQRRQLRSFLLLLRLHLWIAGQRPQAPHHVAIVLHI